MGRDDPAPPLLIKGGPAAFKVNMDGGTGRVATDDAAAAAAPEAVTTQFALKLLLQL